MDIYGQFERRIDEAAVAKILQCIATVPNRREKPIAGDISGHFDFWFDGGAAQLITGWTDYEFADGTQATVGVVPRLSVTIKFKDGRRVTVVQER